MTKLIAVCEFPNSEKQYEYLCDIPDGVNREDLKYAVSLQQACPADAEIMKTKRLLGRLQVLFIREFRAVEAQRYTGELQRLVLVFGMSEFVEHAVRRQKIQVLKTNLERKLEEMSIFEKIKAMGVSDPDTLALAEELKKLLGS